MAGGELQLAAYGAQDYNLTGNPQISFFKKVYRQYTNFSMESIKLDVNGPTLSEENNCDLVCPILRNADLLGELYFCFELPNIYSGKYSATGIAPFYNYEFQWIKNIGLNIINEATLFIGGNKIDKHYGEWMHIWCELNLDDSKKNVLNSMIGNIPELYDPALSEGQGGVYPHITSTTSGNYSQQSERYTNSYYNNIITISDADSTTTIPSIRSKKIKVPLLFWFNRHKGLALPLIALQMSEIEIKLKLKSVNELFTVIEPSSLLTFHKKRIRPGISTHNGLANFIISSDMVSTTGGVRTLNFLDIDPYVEANYIFLDKDERNRFALNEHKYLIEQVQRIQIDGVKSSGKHKIEVVHPTKYMTWVGKRSDYSERNDFNNYTNWIYPNIPPYSKEYNYKTMYGSYSTTTLPFYTVGDSTQKDNFNTEYLNKDILTSVGLSFNGIFRLKQKDSDYFDSVQCYQHFKKNTRNDGIYVYSFSLNVDDHQPSGSCNFSTINLIQLTLNINDLPKNSSSNNYYTYNFNVYILNYNILRVMSGVGALEFSN